LSPKSESELAQPACPQCGSTFVDYLRDPQDGDIVEGKERPLAICRVCETISPIPQPHLASIQSSGSGDDQIMDDRKCRHCGYCLRTLSVGARCPECGKRIVPDVIRNTPERERFDEWDAWNWATLFTFISAGGFLYWNKFNRGDRSALSVMLIAIGIMALLHGGRGLHVGVIKMGRGSLAPIFTGGLARIVSVVSLVFGIAVVTLAALLLAGVIK
jgi:predicted Zn-ribbon and HTH transcriptional regulator